MSMLTTLDRVADAIDDEVGIDEALILAECDAADYRVAAAEIFGGLARTTPVALEDLDSTSLLHW